MRVFLQCFWLHLLRHRLSSLSVDYFCVCFAPHATMQAIIGVSKRLTKGTGESFSITMRRQIFGFIKKFSRDEFVVENNQ